jgi:flagellar motor switch protein FliN/FliY
LLQGADDLSTETLMSESGVSATAATPSGLGQVEKNVLTEMLNVEAESFSTTLSTIMSKKVTFSNPVITEKRGPDIRQQFGADYVNIRLDFSEGIVGDNLFLMKKADASVIANVMMNQGADSQIAEFDELYQSAFGEAISQINGSFITNVTNKYGRNIRVSPPRIKVVTDNSQLLLADSDNMVEAFFSLNLEGANTGGFTQVFSMTTAREMISLASGRPSADSGSFQRPAPAAAPGGGYGGGPMAPAPQGYAQPSVSVQKVELSSLAEQAGLSSEQANNISLLLDVPMQMTVELGRTRMLIKDILGLGEGSIVELDKLAGEPVDILVNNKLVAKGEVVVIDENFGVRVTNIISPVERIHSLNQ